MKILEKYFTLFEKRNFKFMEYWFKNGIYMQEIISIPMDGVERNVWTLQDSWNPFTNP